MIEVYATCTAEQTVARAFARAPLTSRQPNVKKHGMDTPQIFWMQLLTSVVVFGIVAVWYVGPYLTKVYRDSALISCSSFMCAAMWE